MSSTRSLNDFSSPLLIFIFSRRGEIEPTITTILSISRILNPAIRTDSFWLVRIIIHDGNLLLLLLLQLLVRTTATDDT